MSNQSELAKAYNPSDVEDKWYHRWEEEKIFRSVPESGKKPYTIVIPPPNITGSLTMGHILNNTIQDIFIRLKRMQGYNACWVPGTDHASIATETKVYNFLKGQGINKYEIGREEFLKHCYEWKDKYGGLIIQQLRKLGVSCDWDRERFTMDEDYYKKVVSSFVELYNEGKIYRGYRLVNWCPVSKSAISDEEVIPRQVQGKLTYIKYPVKGEGVYITVATTRPETMLGDTGVAVNPDDERYTAYIGKTIILPLTGREIPVFVDQYVDKTFGTGAVKVTPAHDPNDYEMGVRHGLEMINIFNEDASLNHNAPEEFQGLDRYAAREKVVHRLQELGLIEKIEEHLHNVGYSERGGVPIEPYLSEQWFMKMEELSKPALDAVVNKEVNFHPAHWVKTYEHWMSGIRDWCISRQLWWGHRIPVWYHKDTKEMYVNTTPPADIQNWHQDDDVLDTWASSWLWAHDVFRTDEEQKYYLPTDLLVTAPDIIFFWVARMIIATLHFKKEIPFKDVYFTSVIRDLQGRKMSKSLGNSPDPIEVINEYGADALRFTVIYLAPLGQDVLFSAEKSEFGRNFANKLWNAGRFLLMNKGGDDISNAALLEDDLVDKWINSRLHRTLRDLEESMNKFDINIASKTIYSFVWNDFCDWYIELIKNKLYSQDPVVKGSALRKAVAIFESLLQIVHPFMPFITEELWQAFGAAGSRKSISVSGYPVSDMPKIDDTVEKEMGLLQDVITGVRNIRGEMNIPPSKALAVFVRGASLSPVYAEYIKKLAKASEVTISENLIKPAKSASSVVRDCEIFVPLEGLIDLDAERLRLEKEIARLKGALTGVEKKLANQSFVANAPADVVAKEKAKQSDWMSQIEKLEESLRNL
ncbi:MAG: valine--tRNA ligase [Ignavibacteriales bacterium]